tara:strand:- start:9502 stop:9918 length:417 start_codon:yes stop_codon:yes gene_type:complete
MRQNTRKSLCILSIIILVSCQADQKLKGNYAICYNEEYTEVFFKEDSMRAASGTHTHYLSEWRKIKRVKDTLYFQTFGEWRDSVKAIVTNVGANKINLRMLNNDDYLHLEPIDEDIYLEDFKVFWDGFYERKRLSKCK